MLLERPRLHMSKQMAAYSSNPTLLSNNKTNKMSTDSAYNDAEYPRSPYADNAKASQLNNNAEQFRGNSGGSNGAMPRRQSQGSDYNTIDVGERHQRNSSLQEERNSYDPFEVGVRK